MRKSYPSTWADPAFPPTRRPVALGLVRLRSPSINPVVALLPRGYILQFRSNELWIQPIFELTRLKIVSQTGHTYECHDSNVLSLELDEQGILECFRHVSIPPIRHYFHEKQGVSCFKT